MVLKYGCNEEANTNFTSFQEPFVIFGQFMFTKGTHHHGFAQASPLTRY